MEEVFHAALERATAERGAFIEGQCAGDGELAAEVRRLLDDHGRAGPSFIEPPGDALVGGSEDTFPVAAGLPPDVRGRRVGPYTLVRVLGSGGMGMVYEAVQDRPRRTVALKVVRLSLGSASAVRRFGHEAEILGRLRHPGIAQVYGVGAHGEEGGAAPYFAMEFIEGARTITEYADAHCIGVRERIGLFLRVCEAVEYAHQKGVIHRDLKPGNILVGEEGTGHRAPGTGEGKRPPTPVPGAQSPGPQPKIIDFGVARATDADLAVTTVQTGLGQLIGTVAYMSPEQCAADPAELDTRSDVYSLGVVLYELLCGRAPYDVKDRPITEAARVIREEAPRRPSTVARALRGDLETIALKALEKDKLRRYQSVAELGADLSRWLRHEPILARPPSVGHQVRLFSRRHRALVVGGIVVAGVMLAATGVSLVFAVRARERAAEAETARAAAARGLARADRVSEFLQGALWSSNPFVPAEVPASVGATEFDPWGDWRQSPWAFAGQAGRTATVPDILRAAGARLEGAFPDDEATRGRLADGLGWTLYRLRETADAERLLGRAVEWSGAALGPDDEQTIRATLHLAELYDSVDSKRADSMYRGLIAASRRVYGAVDARTLRIERMLANNLAFLQFRSSDAAALIGATVRAAGDGGAPQVLEHEGYLAWMLWTAGDHAGAERAGRHAVEGLLSTVGEQDPRTAEAMGWLGNVLESGGGPGLAEAEGLQRRAVASTEAVFGARSTQAGVALRCLISVLEKQQRWEEVEIERRRLTGIYELLLGPGDFETAMSKLRLARTILRRHGDAAELERVAREAHEAMIKLYGEGGQFTISAAATLADAVEMAGRRDEALEILRGQLAIVHAPSAQFVPAYPVRLRLRSADWLMDAGRWEEARELVRVAGEVAAAAKDGGLVAEVKKREERMAATAK
jgi:serine/threonine protein kinase